MYIGEILKKRMSDLGISISKLSDESLVERNHIEDIINNKIMITEIDKYDLDLISQVLYCNPEYFYNSEARERDILNASMNRGESNFHVNLIKGKLQQFGSDFTFLRSIKEEANEGGSN